jgi:hypothetical protein
MTRRPRKTVKRYTREIPGERVQFGTCEIDKGLYQYTAIDFSVEKSDWKLRAMATSR